MSRLGVVFCILWLPCLGCRIQSWTGFPPGADPRYQWPRAPEPARIGFAMEIREHRDLFSSTGFWRSLGELIGGPEDSTMSRPYALALHPDGGLLVADPGRGLTHFYCWGRSRYFALGAKRDGGLPSPVGVAALDDGRILVSDSRLKSVLCFDAEGKELAPFVAPGLLERPAGLAVSASRREVYVADVSRHAIAVFDFSGRPVRWIGGRGEEPGRLNFPTHLALDPQGRLAVSDSMNFRVQIIEPDGAFVRSVGALGDAPGQFSKPKGVAVDSHGRLIVVEGLYDALQIFDSDGRFLLSLGSSGAEPGQFWLPAGLAIDRAQGLLFVADSYNSRVQVFRFIEPHGLADGISEEGIAP